MEQPCELSCLDLFMGILIATYTSFVFGDCQIICDAKSCNFANSDTPLWVFFTLNFVDGTKSRKVSHIMDSAPISLFVGSRNSR